MMTREEAIKVANEMYGWLKTDREREALETLIPELAESEDEKIAKVFISGLKNDIAEHRYETIYGIKLEEALAWFEKHKEASKAIEAVERIDKYIDEHLANAHDMKDSNPDKKYYRGWDDALGKMAGILQDVYSNEKQKDHFRDVTKMVEKQDYSGLNDLERTILRGFLSAGVENVPVTIINETAKECLAQMKPVEWKKATINGESIPTENHSVDIPLAKWGEDIIRKAVKEVGLTQHQIDWFKTNVFPPKQEWSEEDEIYLSQAIETLEHENYPILANKLKSLRPRPHTVSVENATKFGNLEYERGVKDGIQSEKNRQWKPSKKQIEALQHAIDACESEWVYQDDELRSLLNDIKKL